MTKEEKLVLLKMNLLIKTESLDHALGFYLDSATELIEREGIALTESIEDAYLIIQYASFLYQSRKDPSVSMPMPLQEQMRNRRFAERIKRSKEE